MEVIRDYEGVRLKYGKCVATIGNFDGVHRGHQKLIQQVKALAQQYQLPATVITFEPHPQDYFSKEKKQPRLMKLREKLEVLTQLGVQRVIILRFNQLMAQMPAADFVKNVLVEGIGVRHLVIGDDFQFGFQRQGDFNFLSLKGKEYGYDVTPTETVIYRDRRISSHWVRETLQENNLTLTQDLLGRPYSYTGRVILGNQRGRNIGFPTVNLDVGPTHLSRGVYCVKIRGLEDKLYFGVANLGIRPTFSETQLVLEVHIFSFQQEIYGHRLTIEFMKKLRDEQRFENFELLKEQIAKDVLEAKEYFGLG